MKKTIDLDDIHIQKIEEYKKEKGIRTFGEAVRSIIEKKCTCGSENCCDSEKEKLSDENFALIADALVEMKQQIDTLVMHIAPRNAPEVK
jgi:hypothetical protein